MFSQTKMGSNPQIIHCGKADTLTELFSLKYSPSVNANFTFLKKEKNKSAFMFM